jgi:hypothetical protein
MERQHDATIDDISISGRSRFEAATSLLIDINALHPLGCKHEINRTPRRRNSSMIIRRLSRASANVALGLAFIASYGALGLLATNAAAVVRTLGSAVSP